MAHFAKLDENNVVVAVFVVDDNDINNLPFPESEPVGVEFLSRVVGAGTYVQTSYNNNFRVRYACVGGAFHRENSAHLYGGFSNPKSYDYFVWNDEKCDWVPPVPYPTDGKDYIWWDDIRAWLVASPEIVPLTRIGG